jgi:hypothetical protein
LIDVQNKRFGIEGMTMNYVRQTILAGLIIGSVGFGPIGCASSPTATVPPNSKSAPIVTASTSSDRAAIVPQAEAAQPIANNTPTAPPKVKTVESGTTSITREQAIAQVAELPEIDAWQEYVNQRTAGKVLTSLIVNPETPKTYAGQEYWAVSFYESQATHDSRWQTFLVRVDGQEILVDDLEGKYRSLENWRQQDKPMARVGPPTIESAPEKQLPFVGTKRFNFLNGSGTGQSITIEADGTTTVKLHGTANTSVSYSGPFTNPIIFKDGDGVKLEGDTIYSLRTDGTIAEGCIRADEPCKSALN